MSKPLSLDTLEDPEAARATRSQPAATAPVPTLGAQETARQEPPAQGVVSAPAASGEQLPFPTWERYTIASFLGAGGMGAVYKARDLRLHRSVAIKFLRSSQAGSLDTRQRRRFDREARAQASIEHPHICKISVRCQNSDGKSRNKPDVILFLIPWTGWQSAPAFG